ncbi:hypothetical protein WKI71_23285 [Streptomyces sp. MS1.AVA.1]|uniref:Uncharacterized protein n=1 Tax=Streptomyces machairae TaxID=3134109 RepID=A0ABU8UPJ1_9ACTN
MSSDPTDIVRAAFRHYLAQDREAAFPSTPTTSPSPARRTTTSARRPSSSGASRPPAG